MRNDENFPGLRALGIPQRYAEIIHTGESKILDDVHYGDDRVIAAAFSVKAFPLPDNCIGVVFEDVTDSKRAELALQDSEERFRTISTSAHDAIIPPAAAGEMPGSSRKWAFTAI